MRPGPFSQYKVWLLLFAMLGLRFAPLNAQQYLGTISGDVRDSTGAKIPHANITVTDESTHFTTTGKSNSTGAYSIPFLQPGTFTVRVEMAGFGISERTGVVISAGDNKDVSFDLSASESQNVTVTADKEVLETGTANIGDTFDAKEVTDTPNIGRNPFNLATLTEGFYSSVYAQAKASASTQPFGGVAATTTSNGLSNYGRVTLNGIPDDPPERTVGRYTGFVPSPEAVQEVKVQSALYDAQYGHAGGSIINAVLRAGSNTYHGAAYYVFRNTYINSNTAERTSQGLPRPNDQWNQPGAVLDGPVVIPHLYNGRDKTYFLVAYERIQDVLPITNTSSVPSLKMRNGDFSEILSPAGTCPTGTSYTCLYDPLTGAATGIRTIFPNNDLSARMNPVGKTLLNYYPLPNAPGTGLAGLIGNYIAPETSSPDYYYSFTARFDQQINASNKLTAVYIRNRRNEIRTNSGFPFGAGPGFTHTRDNDGGSVDLVTIFSPKLVLDSRVGGIYHPFTQIYYGYNFDITKLGFPAKLAAALPVQTFPGITMSDGLSGWVGGQSLLSGSTLLAASEILSQAVGKHSLRYGIEYQMLRNNINDPTSGLGTFTFNRHATQRNGLPTAAGDTNSGYSFASLALGYPAAGTQETNATTANQQHYFALFVQDDWRISKNLTLNIGVRWDTELPFTERHDASNAGFCFTCVSPFQAGGMPTLTGGLIFADAQHRYPYRRERDNFQPRIGVAYHMNPRQVIRAGFGTIYPQTLDLPGTTGYSSTTAYATSNGGNGSVPYTSLSDPYPTGLNAPTGRGAGLLTALGQAINFENRDRILPVLYQTSLNIQTQFPGSTLFELGYVGTYTRHLPLSKNINALQADKFSLGTSYLNSVVANPMATGLPSNATLNAATIPEHYLLVPYTQFGAITENDLSTGTTDFIALRARVTKHMSHGLSVHANFTWSKIMTSDYIDDSDAQPTRFQAPQPNLLFTLTTLYRLPRFTRVNRIARTFIGDWQANLVVRKQNGLLVANPTNVKYLQDPNLASAQSYSHMFNNCYLTAGGVAVTPSNDAPGSCNTNNAAFQQLGSYVPTTIHPYMDHVRNMINPEFDLSLFKVFRLHESKTFELRGEFFNVLNSVNYAAPVTTLTSTTFGSVAPFTQANDPRLGQITARINF